MIAYLSANNLPNTAAALRAELSLGDDVFDAATAKKYEKGMFILRYSVLFIIPAHHFQSDV
jgi:hypothetical protein